MEYLVKQISMRIFGSKEKNKAQTSRVIKDRKISSRRTRSSKRDSWNDQYWGVSGQDQDKTESEEFRTAVAAAAFAIDSIETKKPEITQDFTSDNKKTSLPEASTTAEVNSHLDRQPTPTSVLVEASDKVSGTTITSTTSIMKTGLKEPETRLGKADIWEKTEMEKIKERFVTKDARIFEWEKKKKVKAKNKLTRKEGKIEWKRAQALLDFSRKMEIIEKISTGARSKNDEAQKIEETKVKEKANMIRSSGKISKPMFLCC